MVEAKAILAPIQVNPEDEEIPELYSPGLGFAYTRSTMRYERPSMTLVGFTGQRQKSIPYAEGSIRSVTEFSRLQDDERSIKMQARGVGTRMYNTLQACVGTGEGSLISAYTFIIDPAKIVDLRRSSDGTYRGRMAQAARQAGRIIQAKAGGLEATVNRIHDSFGNPNEVDAVLYSQSATMELQQQALGGVEQPEGVPPQFMVIRNPYIVMRKIGEAQL